MKNDRKGHWKIQNSWGSDWGKNGFINVDMFGDNKGTCNINHHGIFSVEFDSPESI